MTEITIPKEISLYDIWRLLAATATKLDRLYATLKLSTSSLAVEPSSPVMQRVIDHPFFGMTSGAESVPDTMARLRGWR